MEFMFIYHFPDHVFKISLIKSGGKEKTRLGF
jgi:hypothetical protein